MSQLDPDEPQKDMRRPRLRVQLEGGQATLGKVPSSDVARLVLAIEAAIAAAASVVVGRPSRRPGRRERVVEEAARTVLLGVDEGSVIPVLELPTVAEEGTSQQGSMRFQTAHVAEVAVAEIFDIVAGRRDGHPVVVEALSALATEMRVGADYEAIGLEAQQSTVLSGLVRLDAPVRRRIDERMKQTAAAREGRVMGTLFEADFESYSARLRSPEGASVDVSFDPSMEDEIYAALRSPTAVEGWVTYDPGTQRVRSVELRRVYHGDQLILGIDFGEFQRHKPFTELQKEQGVSGAVDLTQLFDSESSPDQLDAYGEALDWPEEA